MNVDDYPRDHVHCNTAGEPLVNGMANSDFECCEYCEDRYLAGDQCDCRSVNNDRASATLRYWVFVLIGLLIGFAIGWQL